MGRAKKVVLAYSGGVDTSVCIPYLKQEWGVEEVITFAADLGNQLYPITKGLEANQKVATTNLLNLKHGMPVQVQPAKAN